MTMSKTGAEFGDFTPTVALIEKSVLSAASYLAAELASGRKPQVWTKPDKTLVMNIDLECQSRILAVLGKDHPIVAEEDENSHSLINTESSYFLVDPLDGTTSCRRFMGELGGQVGYGPLVGFVRDHKLSVASFYSVPHGVLLTAVLGKGCFISKPQFNYDQSGVGQDFPMLERTRIQVGDCPALLNAGFLFYLGTKGEGQIMQRLRDTNAIENMYRFGGFANDCSRIARGFEQASVQFAVKPWDFSAVLLSLEAGAEVFIPELDSKASSQHPILPLKHKTPLLDWRIRMNNPVFILHPKISDEFFALMEN